MKRTYTRTMLISDLSEALVDLYASTKVKWESSSEDFEKITYDGIKSWSIIDGEEAKELETQNRGLLKEDECHEYLEIELLDGSKEYFRNSHVEMFIW